MSQMYSVKVSQTHKRMRKESVLGDVTNDLHSHCLHALGAEKRALAYQGLQPVPGFSSLFGVWVIVDQLL